MAVGEASTDFEIVRGVRLAAAACGLKAGGTLDVVLMELAEGSTSAGVFTQNLFAAAPVQVGKRHLARGAPRHWLINSGNANCAVGEVGVEDAMLCCNAVSQAAGGRPEQVMPFSTGVIGERLPAEKIITAVPQLISDLAEDGWLEAARGIMTTDTRPKIGSRQFTLDGKTVTVTGIAKGAGMIQPNMATMLAYIATDAAVPAELLDARLREAVEPSFNRITVDSDTSTNDTVMIAATGLSEVEVGEGNAADQAFSDALKSLCLELAQGLVRDGEGATRFVAVTVEGGNANEDCLTVAYAIANSPLMKTAIFAGDPNWGRIVMAIGKAGVHFEVAAVDVWLGDVKLITSGEKDPGYTEEAGEAVMAEEEISITVRLGPGDASETVWTSDLSHDYVTINAEYRT